MEKPNTKEALDCLKLEVENILTPLGYEVVTLEKSSNGNQTLALYIDFLNNTDMKKHIGLEDCIAVNKAVDPLFETTNLISGSYSLEVSSPGIERPLKKPTDFDRFLGHKVRIHTFRSLQIEELENNDYWVKNKKQKNFIGILEGRTQDGQKIKVRIDKESVTIPLCLVSKSHLAFVPEENL